jgi:hypothetical protein
MTDYTKSTNFATKDALSSGNALKIVKGTEINTEFDNIQTAIATKADLTSPALTGSPTAPTQSYGTSSTTIATTAFVQAALSAIYPVGSIYVNASSTTNPATLLGFGTWTAFGAGKVMVGLNGSDALFDALEETGGSKDSIVVSHTHTATATDSGHTHTGGFGTSGTNGYVGGTGGNGSTAITGSSNANISVTVNTAGASGTNANLQPYITVAMWKRTA